LNAAGVTTREPATFPDALRALSAVKKLDFIPGSRFEYSNSNYILMSLVVERVSGKPLANFVKERYFDPLGMKATIDPLGRVPGRAHSYLMGNGRPELDDSPWEPTGDGSVQTTAGELVKFAPEYWAPRLGGPELLADRFAGSVKGPEGEYGAGMFRTRLSDGTVVFQHSGAWGSFTTGFAMIPAERIAAAVTCNGTGRVSYSVGDLTARALAAWRGTSLRTAPKQRATGPVPDGPVRDIARWLVARLNDGRLSDKALRTHFASEFLREVPPGVLLSVIGGRTAARPFVVAGAVGRTGKSSGTVLVRSAISWDTWTFRIDGKGRIAQLSTQPG
jgi:Beta-lactamase/ORF 12 gene product N-terminal